MFAYCFYFSLYKINPFLIFLLRFWQVANAASSVLNVILSKILNNTACTGKATPCYHELLKTGETSSCENLAK